MRSTRKILVAVAVLAMMTAFAAAPAWATMWDWTDPNTSLTYKVVEADPFYNGGSAGNTVSIADPSLYWAALTENNTANKWIHRAAYAFNFNVLGGAAASCADVFETPKDISGTFGASGTRSAHHHQRLAVGRV